MPDFHNKDDKSILMNFIDDSIITRPNLVKRIAAFHFGSGWGGQVFSKIINSLLDSPQVFSGQPLQPF